MTIDHAFMDDLMASSSRLMHACTRTGIDIWHLASGIWHRASGTGIDTGIEVGINRLLSWLSLPISGTILVAVESEQSVIDALERTISRLNAVRSSFGGKYSLLILVLGKKLKKNC